MSKRKVERKTDKSIALQVGILVIIISAVILFFLIQRARYEKVFFEETVINGVDCSLLTIEEAKAAIEKEEEKYVLEIIFKDNEKETISGAEIDYSIKNLQAELQVIKEEQRRSIYAKGKTYNLDNFSCNKEKLRDILTVKKELQNHYMEEKTEIRYKFNPTSRLFEIEEQNNYYLNFNEVFKVVLKAIEEQKSHVFLKSLYSTVDNSGTLDQLNSFISAQITYTLPNEEEYLLDANILHEWLVQDQDGKYLKNEEIWTQKIKEFVDQLSLKVSNPEKTREFRPTGKTDTVCVEGGNYGYVIDKEAEVQKLKKELEEQKIVTREPCYMKTEVSVENYGLVKSYVEIDLTRQKVWVYVEGKLELETDCVTGCINKGHGTPTGIFTLTYKQKDRILRGDGYASHVNYWMPFNGGIGLHDATWRSSFGGNIYINNGSHGCINLPLESAKKLFDIINYDMPIIVYRS